MKAGLADLKVAQFAWGLAGPFTIKCLADHGAQVVKVESRRRLDLTRARNPYKDDKHDPDLAGYFAFWNANRYSMTLNLNNPRGVKVAKRLVAWADVVVESFSPGMMERWGLGYDDLKKIKPDIIMVRSSAQGQTGPHKDFPAFGIPTTGLAGFAYYTGWPDGPPLPTPHAHSDVISPRWGAVAILAALDYRRRTGRGQYIDLSQLESSAFFLMPLMLDYTVNKRIGERQGNSVPYACPHGVYRCQGDDRWCAIAVFDDDEWRALCKVMGHPQWSREERFATLLGRKHDERELDKLIEGWTTLFTAEQVMTALQAAGVSAGVVQTNEDVCEDPQLRERGYFWKLKHKAIGEFLHASEPFRLSKTPATARMPAPCLGEHTEYVATSILGMSQEEFLDFSQSGAFE